MIYNVLSISIECNARQEEQLYSVVLVSES